MSDFDFFKGEWYSFKEFQKERDEKINDQLLDLNDKVTVLLEEKNKKSGVVSVVKVMFVFIGGGLGAAIFKHFWG